MASNETVESILSSSSFTNSAATATEGGYVDNLPVWVHHFGFALYVIFLVLVFFVDTAILFVFCRLKELRNITNNLLCNMVAADLLFALQTPVEGISILHDMWEWGNDLCRFHRFFVAHILQCCHFEPNFRQHRKILCNMSTDAFQET